jgi:hypothetical protein
MNRNLNFTIYDVSSIKKPSSNGEYCNNTSSEYSNQCTSPYCETVKGRSECFAGILASKSSSSFF